MPVLARRMPQDGDCAYYGHIHAAFPVKSGLDVVSPRTRLIRPECDGSRTVSLHVSENDGELKYRTGTAELWFSHDELKPTTSERLCLEFPSLPRTA